MGSARSPHVGSKNGVNEGLHAGAILAAWFGPLDAARYIDRERSYLSDRITHRHRVKTTREDDRASASIGNPGPIKGLPATTVTRVKRIDKKGLGIGKKSDGF